MSLTQIADAGGSSLNLLDFDGRLMPPFDVEAVKGVASFKPRRDDVIICAYPKSGTHWLWEIVRCLQAGTTDLPLVEKDEAMLEFILPARLEAQPSPRTLNTHMPFDLLPHELFAKGVTLLYVTRDPRDVAVSYYHHHVKLVDYYGYDGHWVNYLPLFMEGQVDYESWFQYTKGWERGILDNPHVHVLVTSYEELHQPLSQFEFRWCQDISGQVRRVAKWLGVDRDDRFIQEVVNKCSFSVMRNTKGRMEQYVKAGSPIMYRKGKVGDWKNWFTVAQAQTFNQMMDEEMRGTNAYRQYSTPHLVPGEDASVRNKSGVTDN